MSRIIVKNLPRYVNEERLRDIFSSQGIVTDVQLKKTADGKSRQFAFVGFKTEEDAENAKKYFNKTFIDTQRISVEIAKKFGEEDLPRPWSKHSKIEPKIVNSMNNNMNKNMNKNGNESMNESINEDVNEKKPKQNLDKIEKKTFELDKNEKVSKNDSNSAKTKKNIFAELENDPQFREFIEIMLPKNSKKIWGNNTTNEIINNDNNNDNGNQKDNAEEKDGNVAKKEKERSNGSGGDGERKGVRKVNESQTNESSLTVSGLGELKRNVKKEGSRKMGGKEEEEESDDEYENFIDDVSFGKNENKKVNNSNLSDLDYLKSKMTTSFSDEEDKEGEEEEGEEEEEELGGREVEEEVKEKERNGMKVEKMNKDEKKKKKKQEKVKKDKEKEEGIDEENDADESKMKVDSNENDDIETDKLNNHNNNNNQNNNDKNIDEIKETGRLFVRNLCFSTTEEEVSELFEKFGNVSEVHIVKEKFSKKSKGFAYVLFKDANDAIKAFNELDGTFFQGRPLHILPAKKNENEENKKLENSNLGSSMSEFKSEKEEKIKEKEEKGFTKAWNSLFINSDTVARGISEKYGISKRDLLDSHGNDTAVKMSLAETQTILETKKFLEEEGVDVSALENFQRNTQNSLKNPQNPQNSELVRSKKILLAKNLPFSTTKNEIFSIFAKFGTIQKFIFPPTKALAIVEFSQMSEAKFAFRGLSYKRLKHVPLYLEWAPENIFFKSEKNETIENNKTDDDVTNDNDNDNDDKNDNNDDNERRENKIENFVAEKDLQLQNFDSTESCSVFVKNLNFDTNEKELKTHFEKLFFVGSIRSVLIKKKKGLDGKELSMGFGFIEFISNKIANRACEKLQGTFLEGHSLVLELSKKVKRREEATEKKDKGEEMKISTKFIVRNVAFEATRKDLLQLFTPFGQIKSLRLPKSFTGKHRGFAFVEFVTKQEAKNALEALQNSHLYGRHLVFENANEKEGLDELRAKAAQQLERLAAGEKDKKRRKMLNETDDGLNAMEEDE